MFYENLCCDEIQFVLPLGDDLGGNLTFKIPPNRGRGKNFVVSHGNPPFDLSGTDLDGVSTSSLFISYKLNDLHNLTYVTVDVTSDASDPSAVTVQEIVDCLNNDVTISGLFTASKKVNPNGSPKEQLVITKKHPGIIRFAVVSYSADRILMVNKYSGVAETPDYLVGSDSVLAASLQFPFTNSAANPTVVTSDGISATDGPTLYFVRSNCEPSIDGEQTITRIDDTTGTVAINVTTAGTRGYFCSLEDKKKIEAAGFSVDDTKLDWEHLKGRAASFPMTKNTFDVSNRITSSILYNAGSIPGTIGKKTYYTYTSSNTTPDKVFEIPYALTADDLVGL